MGDIIKCFFDNYAISLGMPPILRSNVDFVFILKKIFLIEKEFMSTKWNV